MSLLTNPWLQVSMGLLANNGPSLTPVNPWRGIGEGLMNAQNAQYAEQQSAYEQMRMQQEQQKLAAEQQRQQQLQAFVQSLPPDQQAAASVDPAQFMKLQIEQQSAPVKRQGTAGQFSVPGLDPNVPGTATYVGGQLAGFEPTTPPAPQTSGIQLQLPNGQQITAASVQEANKYLENGATYYKPPPSVQITNDMGKGVSVADAANLRYPDGSRVVAGTPLGVIYERGAVSVTQADNTEAVTDVNIKGYDAALKSAGIALKDANAAYKENPSAENYQKLKAARSSAATALAQRRNTKGEPSGEVVREAEANLPLPFSVGGAMGAMLGADPIDAALQEVDSLYGLGIYAPVEKPQAKPKTNGTVDYLKAKYPGLNL